MNLEVDNQRYLRDESFSSDEDDDDDDSDVVQQVQPIAARDSNDVVQQQFQQIAARNEKLAQFTANSSTYPQDQLLDLMRQFDNCPTGRYRLARTLPGVFSF